MAKLINCTMRQEGKPVFLRRIQVLLIGAVAISAIENSAKRSEKLEADLENRRLAKTSSVQAQPSPKPIAPNKRSPQGHLNFRTHPKEANFLKPNKDLVKTEL